MDNLDALAADIADSFLGGRHLSGSLMEPFDLTAAYRLQGLAAARTQLIRCGTKIGATNVATQAFLGASGPIQGPIFSERILEPGASLMLDDTVLGAECELGFTIGKDFPEAEEALSRPALVDAIMDCFPAIEIAARRIPSPIPLTASLVVADLCFAFAVVRGPSISNWRDIDLPSIRVTASVDGQLASEGTGADALGDPLTALAWLAGERAANGTPLRAGEIVVTGSCTGITPLKPGAHFIASFGQFASLDFHVGRNASHHTDIAEG